MWFVFALLSAVFAALTSILAKIGIAGVNSNLATAIRTMVVLVMAWGMVFLTNTQGGIAAISKKLAFSDPFRSGNGCFVVMLLSCSADRRCIEGCADRQAECRDHTGTGICFLHEKFTAKSMMGCILIGVGTLLMVL